MPWYYHAKFGGNWKTNKGETEGDTMRPQPIWFQKYPSVKVHVPNFFGGVSGSEHRGGGDNSIQFINFGRVGDESFKEW